MLQCCSYSNNNVSCCNVLLLFTVSLLQQCSSIVTVLLYSKTGYNDDDVEVGRCISRKINIQCSSSAEVGKVYRDRVGWGGREGGWVKGGGGGEGVHAASLYTFVKQNAGKVGV